MKPIERNIIAAILLLIAALITTDLLGDWREGAALWHLAIEAFVAISALFGFILILIGAAKLRHNLSNTKSQLLAQTEEAQIWREKARSYIEGLSKAIANQLDEWNLSQSEKEIAFMLLKGLSLREIGQIRGTNEKTARAQATNIYQKSGLAGRADLAAFFLEDLLG